MGRVLLGTLLLLPFIASASCYFTGDVTSEVPGYINFGYVLVQRDTPVGAVIATATTGAYNGGDRIAGCTEPWTLKWDVKQWSVPSRLGHSIYRTNVEGVGIRLTNTSLGEVIPYTQERGVEDVVIQGDGIKGELIKTGDITGGSLLPGVLARGMVSDEFYFANVTLNGISTIVTTACSVTSPNIEVPLGEHDKSEFSGRGSGTAWQMFDIGLECDRGARISVRIDATEDSDAGQKDVMALDPDPNAAAGMGVQLWYQNGGAVAFGETHYNQLSAGGNEAIHLQARYYQTLESIKAGQANATATFTMIYR